MWIPFKAVHFQLFPQLHMKEYYVIEHSIDGLGEFHIKDGMAFFILWYELLEVCGSIMAMSSAIFPWSTIWMRSGLSANNKAPGKSVKAMPWPSLTSIMEVIKTDSKWTMGKVVSFGICPCCFLLLQQCHPLTSPVCFSYIVMIDLGPLSSVCLSACQWATCWA